MQFDKIHEQCGVFGIYSSQIENVFHDIYLGLIALQHRGQESAGISMINNKNTIVTKKNMGLVNEVFSQTDTNDLNGQIGIGHVRYSTTGRSIVENAQPFVVNNLAIAHNGNIITKDLRQSDTKIICNKIVNKIKQKSIEEAIKDTCQQIKGGYACLIIYLKKLIGFRDPCGIKPLILGKRKNSYILASESAAIKAIGGQIIRDIQPGEIITIEQNKIKTNKIKLNNKKAHCAFEYIYFARPDSILDNISVYNTRLNMGRTLAKRYPINADIVVGVPDSGTIAAKGYSDQSNIPFCFAFYKNSYVGRTFIKPTQKERNNSVQMKLSINNNTVKGKKIVLIDDSIVRGTTIKQINQLLRQAGADEIHVRISSPPFLYPCYYGTDISSSDDLIAFHYSNKEIAKKINANSLEYLTLEDLTSSVNGLPLCMACFNKQYPI